MSNYYLDFSLIANICNFYSCAKYGIIVIIRIGQTTLVSSILRIIDNVKKIGQKEVFNIV